MAVLAIGAAGAAIGAGVGVAAGAATFGAIATAASIGFSIGTMLGNMLFPPNTKQEGSRLTDLTVQSSAYGTVRPIAYGQVRVAGNIIWALPIHETKKVEKKKAGGKGGPTVTSTTYTYQASMAIAFCEGPADKVLRIWADSKLCYDATAGSDTIKRPGFKFRFYPGNETQLADSIIEADKGVGNVPGYRGTCYIVFDMIELADFGNRIPNITAEIVFDTEPDLGYIPLVRASPSIFSNPLLEPEGLAVDLQRGVGYVQGLDPNGLVVFDLATMHTIREKAMADILLDGSDGGLDPAWLGFGGNNIYVSPADGALYFRVGDAWNDGRYVRIDPNTLTETASFPSNHLFGSNATGFNGFPHDCALLSYYSSSGTRTDYLATLSFWGDWGLLLLPGMGEGSGRASGFGSITGVEGSSPNMMVSGSVSVGVGDVWILSMSSLIPPVVSLYITRLSIGREVDLSGLENPSGAVATLMATLTAADIDPSLFGVATAGFSSTPGSLSYDSSDDTVVFACTTMHDAGHASGMFIVKWSPLTGLVYATEIPNGALWNSDPSNISSGSYAKFEINKITMFDVAAGTVQWQQNADSGSVVSGTWPIDNGLAWAQLYDSDQQVMYAHVSDGSTRFFAKIFLGRWTGLATTLGDIVADQCERAGMIAGDFNVTELTDVVQGFVVTQRATVIDVLTPLLTIYLVDAVETDYVLYFKHRGHSEAATIIEDELIRINDANTNPEPFTEVRQQEVELPMRVTFTYTDKDRNYETNTQAAKRARNPDPTVFSDNQSDLNVSIVSTATPAKQITEIMLFTAWNERHSFQVRLPPKYDYLDPADAIGLTLNDGYTTRARLGQTQFGVDYSLDTKLICETDGQYVSIAEADAGVPWSGSNSIPALENSVLILLDIPLLRDIDDLGGRATRGYWASAPYHVDTSLWPGAILQEETVTDTWETLDATGGAVTWGYVSTAPADPASPFLTQYDGSMVVGVTGGGYEPSSVSDEDLANFANPIALIKGNGEVEILQYRDATSLGSNLWQLDVLRRGQRGTDTMASGHTAGETFVFLDPSWIYGLELDLAERNVGEFYRAVTNGTLSQDAPIQGFTFHGRDEMPYAVVDVQTAATGSPADLVITWKRRTRIGGLQADLTDTVPLSETSEAYEAYVIASAGAYTTFDPTDAGTYVRKFTASSATVTYTSAEMTADVFDPAADTLYIVVYQLSGVVGRGFPRYAAVPAF